MADRQWEGGRQRREQGDGTEGSEQDEDTVDAREVLRDLRKESRKRVSQLEGEVPAEQFEAVSKAAER